MGRMFFYDGYIPYVDVCVIAFAIIYMWLLASTYAAKKHNLLLFYIANYCVMFSAIFRIASSLMMDFVSHVTAPLIMVTHYGSYILLVFTLAVFFVYITNLIDYDQKKKMIVKFVSLSIFGLYTIWEIATPILHHGFYIDHNYMVHNEDATDIYLYVSLLYVVIMMVVIYCNRNKFITKMYHCICQVTILAEVFVTAQILIKQNCFTCISYSFLIITAMFLFHYNSYDTETGTLDEKAFETYIGELKNKEHTLVFVKLLDIKNDKLHQLSTELIHFTEQHFKGSCTFRLGSERLVLVYEDAKNLRAVFELNELKKFYDELYEQFQMDYKVIVMHSRTDLKGAEDYLALCEFIEDKVRMNSSYEVTHEDIAKYLQSNYIIQELHDIFIKGDLDDDRVKVYCQPVYNTKTNTFTSAESLMRLELPEMGMVYPDLFIPLAEKHEYVHYLSMIILNKTCKMIKTLLDEGYKLDRISVNFAMAELRDSHFCDEVERIVKDNDIPFEMVALELTESMNEAEFGNVRNVMGILHNVGMKFYLDDFGTGYSNFERIMKLPIDIIKFDRSLTIMAGNDSNTKNMVVGFTEIFRKANYQILFEGVEDEADEELCIGMNAMYLQGYKYSKPIPIEQLVYFLDTIPEIEKVD